MLKDALSFLGKGDTISLKLKAKSPDKTMFGRGFSFWVSAYFPRTNS